MKCRHCAKDLHIPFLDLGSAPPSNAYLSAESLRAPETWYPLRLLVCDACWLVQTEDHAGRDDLFNDSYAYFSSYSTSWLRHAEAFVDMAVSRFGLDSKSMVVEVAANDGYLLQYVQNRHVPCYGIEPTASTAAAAKEKGLRIVERFFGRALARELAAEGVQADLMAANNVLAHVPDINDFVEGFALLLKPSGVATFEFPHLLNMINERQFDTAYHEHFSYLSLTAVAQIFKHNGLSIFDVERLPTHGGSLRVFAQKAHGTPAHAISPAVDQLLEEEQKEGIASPSIYQEFQHCAEDIKDQLVSYLIESKHQGLRVGAYGAAAKGNTLLNFAGIRPDLLPYVVDRNPAKKGQFLPGSRIPIVGEDMLQQHRPDRILILPWNLREEITAQLQYAREWGAKFVVAIPELREI